MVHLMNTDQTTALSIVLDTEAGADHLDIAQLSNQTLVVTRISSGGACEHVHYINTAGVVKPVLMEGSDG